MSNTSSLFPLKMLLFSFHASNTIIISFLPIYLQYKGLNGTEIGWVLAIGPLASILAEPFWGYMSDKFKTVKWVLFICAIGLLIGSTIFFNMNTLLSILLMGAVFYFFTTPISGLGDSLAQRNAQSLGISFGSIRTWGSIGFAVSSLIIGEFLARAGIAYMIWPYLFFGTLVLITILRLQDVKVESEPVQLSDLGKLIKNKPLLIFFGLMLFLTVSHRTNDSYMALYINELGGSESLIGIAWFVGVVVEAAVFAFAGFWFRKYHTLVFIILSGILYTFRWFAFANIENPLYIVALQFLHGLTFGVFYTAAIDYVTRLIPKLLQSTGHLVFFSIFFGLSGIIGSLVGGAILENFGGAALYQTMGWVSAIGTLLFVTYHALPFGKENKVRESH